MKKCESLSANFQELGIPQHEITPSVSIAVTGLLDHIAQLNKSLNSARQQFEHLQTMVDVQPEGVFANRKALIKRINWSIAMNKRYGGATSIASFSVSDFDSITRTYGYEAAARTVIHVAEFLNKNIRDTDFFARISENQFTVIMYFAQIGDIKAKAEKICNELRNSPFTWNNSVVNINISAGVHEINPADDAENALLASLNATYTDNSKQKFEQINFKA